MSIIGSRRAVCQDCGADGVHVDTTAGEIIVRGDVVAVVPFDPTCPYLLCSESPRGELVCEECQHVRDEHARKGSRS